MGANEYLLVCGIFFNDAVILLRYVDHYNDTIEP